MALDPKYGKIELIDMLGSDQRVIDAARICWDSFDKGSPDSNQKLIRHLIKKGHGTPFEHVVFTFKVKCPIFVARQWMRHRICSYNERSLRFCSSKREFYNPYSIKDEWHQDYIASCNCSFDTYEWMVGTGVPKEEARLVLPLSTMTEFLWTINLRSLMNFLTLRLDKSAQKEIRRFAETIYGILREKMPIVGRCFEEQLSERED